MAALSLVGQYNRTVDSRYGVANPLAHSLGSETIAIRALAPSQLSGPFAYTKLHLYAEQVDQERLQRAYQETGRVDLVRHPQSDALLVLLTPQEAGYSEREFSVPADVHALDVRLPDLAGITWERVSVPDALLYYYEAAREEPHIHYRDAVRVPARLTPFAYEAFGHVFGFGIFEGSESPYDLTSRNFREALRIWNGKRNQPHAYVQKTGGN